MNAARFFRRLKRKINSYGIALPIEDPDQYIKDILEDTTLPVFSLYHYKPEFEVLDMHTAQRGYCDIGEECDLYILPDEMFEGRELLYVRSVEYAADRTAYSSRYCATGGQSRLDAYAGSGVSALEQVILANAEKPIIDAAINPVTFKYIYPKKLYIYDAILCSRLRLTLACEHDLSLLTIEPSAAESFYKLAVLDVMAGLYDLVRPHENVKSAFDDNELKIDDWREAAGKREELIREWDETYGLDQGTYEFG